MTPLIIDTDPGVDDALAIAMAVADPDINLIGLTTIFGNTFTPQSSRNARFLLDLFGHHCPVAQGASLPIGADNYDPAAEVHGAEGLGALADIPEIGVNDTRTAAKFLVDAAAAHPGALTVCAIGPLTNIAEALRLDPDFGRNLGRLVIMGGAYRHPGNITPFAEANIFHDAIAADLVFAADLKTTLVALDTTMQTLLTPQHFVQMAESAPRIGGFLREIHDFYLQFYRSVGVTNGCPMHDATALLACVAPERFTSEAAGIRVVTSGQKIGQTVADPSRPALEVTVSVDAEWAVDEAMRLVATYN